MLTGGPSRQVPALPDSAELARSFRVEGWGLEAVIKRSRDHDSVCEN